MGWKAGDMISGIDGIMNLAAASGEDLATTSDIVTDALTAFGMSAGQSGELADVLAAASSNANTNVSMMGESFKYVASVAGAMDYSCQDTAIALGLMANSGVKASQAGTSLRSIMSRLASPTKEVSAAMDALGLSIQDGDGNLKSFRQVMDDMRSAFADSGISIDEYRDKISILDQQLDMGVITKKQYEEADEELARQAFTASGALNAQYASAIAGANGMSGLLAIVGASEADYQKLCDAVDGASDSIEYNGEIYEGTAAKMAAVMQDNLPGQITLLKSALEELAISAGDVLMPTVRDVVGKIQDVVDWLNNLDDGTKKTVVQIGAVVAASGPLLIGIGKVSQGLSSTIDFVQKAKIGFDQFKDSGSGLGKVIGSLPGGFGLATAAIGGLALATVAVCEAVNNHYDAVEKELEAMDGERAYYAEVTEEAKKYNEEAENSRKTAEETIQNFEMQSEKAEILADKMGDLIEKDQLSASEKERLKTMVEKLNEIYPELGFVFDDATGKVKDNTDKVIANTDALNNNLEAAKKNAKEKAYQAAIQEQTDALISQELAYTSAGDAASYWSKTFWEGKEKLDELRDSGTASTEEINKLSDSVATAEIKMREANIQLQGCAEKLRDNQEALYILQNQMDTGGTTKIGQGMLDSLDSLVKKSEEVGIKIPESLSNGIRSGEIEVREAATTMASLEVLNRAVDESGKIGGRIPVEMANEILVSSPTVADANEKLMELIDFSETLETSARAGQEIPAKLAECIGTGSIDVQSKMDALEEYIQYGTTHMADELIANTQRGVDGAENSIQTSSVDNDASNKANQTHANWKSAMDQLTPTTTAIMQSAASAVQSSSVDQEAGNKGTRAHANFKTGIDQVQEAARSAMAQASGAIAASDAPQQAASKAAQINGSFNLGGLGRAASDAAGAVNAAMASIITQYNINISVTRAITDIVSSGIGTLRGKHADGGIFTRPTLIPSMRGNPHLVGEAGAEAILPLDQLSPMMESAVANVLLANDGRSAASQSIEIDYDKLANAMTGALSGVKAEITTKLNGKVLAKETAPLIDRELSRLSHAH